MGKVTYWTCDKCGKKIDSGGKNKFSAYLNPDNSYSGKQFDWVLCDDCARELLKWTGTEEKKAKKKKIVVDPDAKDPVYDGYSSHDCESWYHCPTCGYQWGSWAQRDVFKDDNKCPKCGQKLILPR